MATEIHSAQSAERGNERQAERFAIKSPSRNA